MRIVKVGLVVRGAFRKCGSVSVAAKEEDIERLGMKVVSGIADREQGEENGTETKAAMVRND